MSKNAKIGLFAFVTHCLSIL